MGPGTRVDGEARSASDARIWSRTTYTGQPPEPRRHDMRGIDTTEIPTRLLSTGRNLTLRPPVCTDQRICAPAGCLAERRLRLGRQPRTAHGERHQGWLLRLCRDPCLSSSAHYQTCFSEIGVTGRVPASSTREQVATSPSRCGHRVAFRAAPPTFREGPRRSTRPLSATSRSCPGRWARSSHRDPATNPWTWGPT